MSGLGAAGVSSSPMAESTSLPGQVRCQASNGKGAQGSKQAVQTIPKETKWTGGLKDIHLDCPVEILWELIADWAHWDRFYPSDPSFRMVSLIMEGENRTVGCKRYVEVLKDNYTSERLLALDNANYYFSYNMEENVFCGGLSNYIGKVKFRGTSDGKTVLEYWSYEVDPLTTMSKEAFTKFIGGFLSQKLVAGVEAKAKSLATKWTGGLEPMTLDAPVEVVWDLAADWINWQQFVPSEPDFPLVIELRDGENRKLGCKRHADLAPGVWIDERLIAIDNVSHYFSYNIEENMFAGGVSGYVNRVQFKGTKDGKTLIKSANWEVEPKTDMSREEWTTFITGFLTQKIYLPMEAKAKQKAAERWTGGLEPMRLDCKTELLWELAADWAHWDRFYPSAPDFPMVSTLMQGVNRSANCKRYAEVAKGSWTTERLLAIDNDDHYFSYNMEENVFCGGLKNYVAKVKVP
ncbi:hypothetical protein KC19_4G270700 [Ceratodon purpureus]|uniref:Uncharacterized protein n=1 Tax=Ceratodon purpureus TaxID=3225 RepID=A0A8T0IGU1_CERPU|nr:hypothetical protein KC19_4G270700 [Ceratodon purpureus]